MNLKIETIYDFVKSVKRLAKKYKNIKQDLQILKQELKKSNNNSINLGDNFYKIRLKNSSTNQGKSSRFRVVYFYQDENNTIYLLDIYTKNEIENITKEKLQKLVAQYNL
jgi:mRNA-degrading endonuclease RelE of RelBE toxin-antitoxin system